MIPNNVRDELTLLMDHVENSGNYDVEGLVIIQGWLDAQPTQPQPNADVSTILQAIDAESDKIDPNVSADMHDGIVLGLYMASRVVRAMWPPQPGQWEPVPARDTIDLASMDYGTDVSELRIYDDGGRIHFELFLNDEGDTDPYLLTLPPHIRLCRKVVRDE